MTTTASIVTYTIAKKKRKNLPRMTPRRKSKQVPEREEKRRERRKLLRKMSANASPAKSLEVTTKG
jgi:ribosomal protein S30